MRSAERDSQDKNLVDSLFHFAKTDGSRNSIFTHVIMHTPIYGSKHGMEDVVHFFFSNNICVFIVYIDMSESVLSWECHPRLASQASGYQLARS